MEYPYEGDLLAIFDGVTIPKLVSESFAVVCSLVCIPAIQFQADDIFDDAWWSMRMTQQRNILLADIHNTRTTR